MSNELKELFDEQRSFQTNFFDVNTMTLEEKVKWSKENLLCASREIFEVLNELPWKIHRKYDENTYVDTAKLNEEIVDVIKYILNLFVIWKIDENEFLKMFRKKSRIVRQRFKRENND
jgi:NTP pyrophosphatase (non-canonical NTP hydrolase)